MNSSEKRFIGFTQFSETWNGRLAMMGLVIALAEELITGQGFLHALRLL
ncbi:MAG: high light inducible protein [Thermosynechococcaceae cyanobacterium]